MSQDDIFADWKRNRFIVGDNYLTGVPGKFLIVLTDLQFWSENIEKLDIWCRQYCCDHQGMTVVVPNDEILTLFNLRWL